MSQRKCIRYVMITIALHAMCNPACVYALTIGSAGEQSGLVLTPSLSAQLRYDSNIHADETAIVSSAVSMLRASVAAKYASSSMSYQATKGNFLSSAADNFIDHSLSANTAYGLSDNVLTRFSLGYQLGHEERGSGFSQGVGEVLSEPDTLSLFSRGGSLRWGTSESMLNLELEANLQSRLYLNHPDSNSMRNYDSTATRVTLLRNLSVKTAFLMEFGRNSVIYSSEAAGLDSVQQHYFAGVDWQYSELTSGSFKAGWQTRAFAESGRSDYGSWGWAAGLSWAPSILTTLTFDTSSQTSETSGTGDYILVREAGAGIRQTLFGRLNLLLQSTVTLNAYLPGAARDGVVDARAGIDTRLTRWMSLGVEYGVYYRKANRAGLNAQRSVAMLQIQLHH